MLKTIIVLPDGTELSSGSGTVNAIQSVTITECVNEAEELTLGSACTNALEAKLITPEGGLPVSAGDELAVYKVDENGTRHKVGLFTTEKPTRPSANTMSITAYDRVSWLDKDLSEWLYNLKGWPYSLYDFAVMVCEACGLNLLNESLLNGDYQIQAFSGEGITGRHLIRWVGQVAGRFCRATVDGEIELAWYKLRTTAAIGVQPEEIPMPLDLSVEYDGEGNLEISSESIAVEAGGENVTIDSDQLFAEADVFGNVSVTPVTTKVQYFFYQNSLNFEDYQVAPIEKVQIRLTDEDVGAVYPDTTEELNTYVVAGNYLLTNSLAQPLETVAQNLYQRLHAITYTPCKVSIPANLDIHAGDVIDITDRNGKTITAYIMIRTQAGQRDTLECTGSPKRDSSTAVNTLSFKALTGKVMNLRADVEGLKAENKDASGNLARLTLDVEGISTEVSRQQTQADGMKTTLTKLTQDAEAVALSVQKIQEDGVNKVATSTGYTFGSDGLVIRKDGGEMENLLDDTGMYVKRSGEVILKANNEGVLATDVTVRNYLVVGEHARFEDYTNGTDSKRTACFWM